ncbi:hypothetical protein VTN96DRAFT_6984 [Rasamsonia emersonii]
MVTDQSTFQDSLSVAAPSTCRYTIQDGDMSESKGQKYIMSTVQKWKLREIEAPGKPTANIKQGRLRERNFVGPVHKGRKHWSWQKRTPGKRFVHGAIGVIKRHTVGPRNNGQKSKVHPQLEGSSGPAGSSSNCIMIVIETANIKPLETIWKRRPGSQWTIVPSRAVFGCRAVMASHGHAGSPLLPANRCRLDVVVDVSDALPALALAGAVVNVTPWEDTQEVDDWTTAHARNMQ